MGQSATRLFGTRERTRLTMVGPGQSKRVTDDILHALALGEVVTSTVTIGLDIAELEGREVALKSWGLGGSDALMHGRNGLFAHLYAGTRGLIFVLDCQTAAKIRRENGSDCSADFGYLLRNVLNKYDEELRYVPLLVYADGCGPPGAGDAWSSDQIADELRLSERHSSAPWRVQSVCSSSGTGVKEGFEWLMATIHERGN